MDIRTCIFTLKALIKDVNISKKRVFIIFICFLFISISSFLQPVVIKKITDEGLVNKNINLIIIFVIVLIILVLINKLTDVYLNHIFANIHNELELNIFKKAFSKLLCLKQSYFCNKNPSEIIDMLTMDVNSIVSIVDKNNIMLINYFFQIISGLIGLIIISPILTLVVIIMMPIKYLSVTKFADKTKRKMSDYLGKMSHFASWMSEVISGIKEIKLWGEYKNQEKQFYDKQKKLLLARKEFVMLDSWNIFTELFLEWLVIGILYILGGYLYINDTISLGGLFAFISYSSFVTGPIAAIFNIKMTFAHIKPSIKRFLEFLDLDEENNSGDRFMEYGDIVFHKVSFTYDNRRIILKDLNFTIPKGSKVAIIGRNGSGKSTILNLLIRFLEPSSGVIKLNDVNISEFDLIEYRKLFSVVSQNPYVFNKSIRENIDLNNNYKLEDIQSIYYKSGIIDSLLNLADSDSTIIGNNGAKISGGEKQKIAVARALLKNSPYIILDEPSTGYDVDSNKYLQYIIKNDLSDKTVIMVTHNLDSISDMDIVYELENGRIIRIR